MQGFGFPASDGSITASGTEPISFRVMRKDDETSTVVEEHLRLSPGYDIATIKRRLHTVSGIAPAVQKLTLLHLDGSTAFELDDDRKLLDSYDPLNGWSIQVSNATPRTGDVPAAGASTTALPSKPPTG